MDIAEFLAVKGRTRLIAGDVLPPKAEAELIDLVRRHRTALGLPVLGYGPITAQDGNAALDWQEQQ